MDPIFYNFEQLFTFFKYLKATFSCYIFPDLWTTRNFNYCAKQSSKPKQTLYLEKSFNNFLQII